MKQSEIVAKLCEDLNISVAMRLKITNWLIDNKLKFDIANYNK